MRRDFTIARTTAKRATRSGALLGAVLGLLVWNEAASYHTGFPTHASADQFARTMGANGGLTAVAGPGRRLDTIEGFVAWRMFSLLIVVGAIWGLLTATRLLRGEEDAGRWELLLAGRTTRRNATAQALVGLAAGFLTLWAFVAGFTVAAGLRADVGFSTSACLFYAVAGTASAALFLGVGALTSQLAPTRRQANGLAAAIFGIAYLVRMVADAGTGLAWMRWLSPLGWIENLRPLTGSGPLVLLPLAILIVALLVASIALADRRDVGAGVLARGEVRRFDPRLLGSPASLVVRLERWVALAWIVALASLALLFGVVARSAAAGHIGDTTVAQAVGRLGGAHRSGAVAWIGYEFLYIAALVAFAAAGQVSAMRKEEADGQLDNLLARAVDRRTWLAGHLGFAVALVVAAGLSAGIGGWVGIATGSSGIGFFPMVQAGLNLVAPALFVLGVGTLLFGAVPRIAVPLLYGLVLWSFVVEIIGTSITTNHWLLDTAVLSHVGPVPATSLNWTAIASLTALALFAAALGLTAFDRRDLASA